MPTWLRMPVANISIRVWMGIHQMAGIPGYGGRADVTEAIHLVNQFGRLIGLKPYEGKVERKKPASSINLRLVPY